MNRPPNPSRRLGSLAAPLCLLLWLVWPSAPALAATPPVLLVVGDSLSAAYGMETARGWVALLQERIAAGGWPYRVVNASISGDTTRGGRSRLASLLERHRPALVVVELGGNDGLRGVPPEETERNLEAMVRAAAESGARVLLVGIRLPPNYGAAFNERFRAVFGNVAARQGVPLVPFLLEGVGGDPAWMLEDGIHPRAEAQPRLLENVWPHLEPLLGEPAGAGVPAAHSGRTVTPDSPPLPAPSPAVLSAGGRSVSPSAAGPAAGAGSP